MELYGTIYDVKPVELYKNRGYLKEEINKLQINVKNKNIRHLHRGTNEFKKD
jgi:hypothetical protein